MEALPKCHYQRERGSTTVRHSGLPRSGCLEIGPNRFSLREPHPCALYPPPRFLHAFFKQLIPTSSHTNHQTFRKLKASKQSMHSNLEGALLLGLSMSSWVIRKAAGAKSPRLWSLEPGALSNRNSALRLLCQNKLCPSLPHPTLPSSRCHL